MPRAIVEIEDTWASITRPVAVEASRHINKLMGLPKTTPVLFQGPSQVAALEGSTLEGETNPARFSQTRKVFVQVTEEYAEDDMLNMATHKPDHVAVFRDHTLAVGVYPLYSRMKMTITLKYRAEDQVSADKWRNLMRRKVAEGRSVSYHSLEYYYSIPQKVVMLLNDTYRLREAQAGYSESIETYFKKCFSPKATTLTDMKGSNPTLAIREQQNCAVGYFNFDIPPEKEKTDEGAVWEVSVEYTLIYDKPISLSVKYPVLVHNQMLPERWFDQEGVYREEAENDAPSHSQEAYDRVIATQGRAHDRRMVSGAYYPKWDDWFPKLGQRHTSTIIRIMLMVSPTDLTEVCNLTQLGPYNIHPLLIPFIQENYRYLPFNHESPFVVEVFQDDDLIDPKDIVVGNDLNVRISFDMSLRRTYRLRLSLVNNLTILSDAAIKRLLKHGNLCLAILVALEPRLVDWSLIPGLNPDGSVKRDEFWEAVQKIKTTNEHYRTNHEIVRTNVLSFVVGVHRMTSLTKKDQKKLDAIMVPTF